MKKLLFAGLLLLSVAAIHASNQNANKTGLAFAQSHWNIQDTVPSDTSRRDTTMRDSSGLQYSWNNIQDSVPKDTTVKDSTGLQHF